MKARPGQNPKVAAFQEWVTSEVLPSIRKTGHYAFYGVEIPKTLPEADDPFRHFVNEKFGDIRITDREGKPWAIARDVAKALGYKKPQRAIRVHCKGVTEMVTPTAGGIQKVKIINQKDIFRLVMGSELDAAEEFQDWLVEEVLPGFYHEGHHSVRVSKVAETYSGSPAQPRRHRIE